MESSSRRTNSSIETESASAAMIWIKYGRLASFEYYSLSDLEYDRLPLPTEIRHEEAG